MLQLAFINNPLSGAMILSVLFATNWKVGLGASLGGAIATIAEMVTVITILLLLYAQNYYSFYRLCLPLLVYNLILVDVPYVGALSFMSINA